MSDQDQPKIIVDDDWKSQAKAEKEKLAEQDAKAKAAAAEQGGEAGDGQPTGPAGFEDIVKMFATQALMFLGVFPDPQTGKAMVAPEYAKQFIEMIAALQEKTKGNLDAEEKTMLDTTLSELRFQYVEVVKAVEQAIAEGKIKPGAPGMQGGQPGGAGPGGGAMPPMG